MNGDRMSVRGGGCRWYCLQPPLVRFRDHDLLEIASARMICQCAEDSMYSSGVGRSIGMKIDQKQFGGRDELQQRWKIF